MIWATRGGVAVGIVILVLYLIEWWPGWRALKKKPLPFVGKLLPFALAWLYGMLGILTTMGLIGLGFDSALWAANWLGDVAGWVLAGAQTQQASRGVYAPLSGDGVWMVVIFTAVAYGFARKGPYQRDVRRGVLVGMCLGTSAGIAGLAAVPVASATNTAGMYLFNWIG